MAPQARSMSGPAIDPADVHRIPVSAAAPWLLADDARIGHDHAGVLRITAVAVRPFGVQLLP
jgi:hypothetical protein